MDDCVKFVKDRLGHDFRYAIDNTKLKKELCWEPLYNDIEKELETLRTQLKSGVKAIALPPSDLYVNEVKTVEIQEVEVELEEMKKSMDNS